jgi:dipeptidyl-peptidase-4
MNKIFLTLAAISTSITLNAQPGVVAVHPAGDPSGKDLTMHDVILSRDIVPQRHSYSALANGAFTSYSDNDGYREIDPATGNSAPYTKPDNKIVSAISKIEGSVLTNSNVGGRYIYTLDKGLYYMGDDLVSHAIALPENDQITYGQSVSRNEFGIWEGTYPSPDGSRLAFYRKDESRVTDFPLLDITTRTGSLVKTKYPMNGMDSEYLELHIYDFASGKTVVCKVDDFGYDQYLTNVSWSPEGDYVFMQVLDRSQKHMHLNMYSAADGSFVKTILTEDDSKYVEPLDHIHFLKGTDLFIYRTNNRDGYMNLYLCDYDGHVNRITKVAADVAYVDNDGKSVFYTSAEVSPVENHLFRTEVKLGRGKKASDASLAKFSEPVALSPEEGWHTVEMSSDCRYYVDSYSSFNVPRVENLRRSSDGSLVKELSRSADPLAGYATGEVDFGTVKSADGKYDNYYRLFKPKNFDPSKKYPLVVYVYGGPHSQMVRDSWLGSVRLWEEYMAQRGYIVYVQDNRGTENRGKEFEQVTHDRLGQAEMADQMEGIAMLKSLPYVDADRIGVHGWSYGGYMTISLMTHHPDVFKVGVAGGPVIDWKWYEVMYGERYMDTMETNPEGFAETSLLSRAKDLKGKLLICQGAIDKTVVWEHSLSFVRECIKNNVQLDYFPYPCAEHNVMGKDRIHLMDKVTAYFDDNL